MVVRHLQKQILLKQFLPFVQYVIREYRFAIIEVYTNVCLSKKQQPVIYLVYFVLLLLRHQSNEEDKDE